MSLTLRPGTPADAERCGTICYAAFKTIADRHQFPPDFPSPQAAVASTERRLSHPAYYGVVADLEGRIVGSVFLDELPGARTPYRAANDAHEYRPLQRAAGGILALNRLLKGLERL